MRLKRHRQPDEHRTGNQEHAGVEASIPDESHEVKEQLAVAPIRPGPSGRLRALWDDPLAGSREGLEHEAARELQDAALPAMEQLLLQVPGSATYEEALSTLSGQADFELDKPVKVRPETVIDLCSPPEMRCTRRPRSSRTACCV